MSRFKITLPAVDADRARSLQGVLENAVHPAPDAVTLFENGPAYLVEAYFAEAPDVAAVSQALADATGVAPDLEVAEVPALNWVAISQAALPPVVAGRFTIHGSHDRGRVPRGPNTIEIDAGEAFGTAHHATTLGCLEAIDRLGRRQGMGRVLDLGCGTGVLAIAAARVWRRAAAVTASDIDPQAVRVTRDNARLNGMGGHIRSRVAEGLPRSPGRRGFDLVVANILAGPLIGLAPAIARAVRRGGTVVLSGILIAQAAQVLAAFSAAGFARIEHRRIAGWSTLVLVRR